MGPNKKKQTFSQFLSLRKPQDFELPFERISIEMYIIESVLLKISGQKCKENCNSWPSKHYVGGE